MVLIDDGAGQAGAGGLGGARPGGPPRPVARLAAAVEGAAVLDRPAATVEPLAGWAAGTQRRRDLLSGTWLGHPVHPLLVAAPIGLYSGASLLDILGQRRAARCLVGAGLATTVPTALAGLSDWHYTAGAARRVGLAHMAANTVASVAYAASWLARRRGRDGRGALLAVAGAAALGAGGWLGAHLSYGLGIGVDTTVFDRGSEDWVPLDGDVPAAGPAVGAALAVTAGGVDVVVAGTPDGPAALAGRCTHRGGPLAEGEVAGGCVRCPWHGARFDLRTGDVVAGPAVVPEPAWDLRRTDGGWEARERR